MKKEFALLRRALVYLNQLPRSCEGAEKLFEEINACLEGNGISGDQYFPEVFRVGSEPMDDAPLPDQSLRYPNWPNGMPIGAQVMA